MPRPAPLIFLSCLWLGAIAFASHILGPNGRASAQVRDPLTGAEGPGPAPSWTNTSWLNSDRPLTLDRLRGRVVLLNFWVFTCYNCTNTVPSLVDFDRKYRDRGLTVIGIHTPEFPPYAGEHDRGNLLRALKQYHIEYPNAQDNDSRTWNLYGIRFWPSFVLIDKAGIIRYQGAGEFHLNDETYDLWDRRIRGLLAE
jgi:thiol-disulfide isomerase/thioredoxin